MTEPMCDFCSSPDVRWAFPSRDFSLEVPVKPRLSLDWGSHGSWAACPACHAIIVRSDRERLAVRAAKRSIRRAAREGDPAPPLSTLLSVIRRLHDKFWSNRNGDPLPCGPGDPDPFERTTA